MQFRTRSRGWPDSFRWGCPEGAKAAEDNSALVEFTLSAEGPHTRPRVVESGLAALGGSAEERASYRDDHSHGWEVHLGRLREYVPRKERSPVR